MNNVVIVSATRTAVGKFGGSLINILTKYDHIVPLVMGSADRVNDLVIPRIGNIKSC